MPHNDTNLPIDGHYDTTTLARERLQGAEAHFQAILALLDSPHGMEHAKRVAGIAAMECSRAAEGFDEQARTLEAQGKELS
ncbi:hypothetical protein HNO51_12445 [Billgrantia sulfidoxydans]|uniref:Uncharacterized protein n=1 Tax=Billgrantia sulfidoxydans TaxID=2733484 RepID=A0ABX7W4U8_9GAMM|nr:hypothetical protein [Halomonas sulfidoxydans]QTP55418.1 hypothetical protein HNO51_12445 [Halomonas sulfidoxydans]